MKKRVLALVMSTAMIASMLTACGGSNDKPAQGTNNADSNASANNTTDNNASANNTADNNASADNNAAENQTVDFGSGQIKIWVPDAITDVTDTLCKSFFEAHPEMNGYTVAIEPMGEGEAAGKNFYFDTGSWYQTAFFFATGCELSFETDEKGNFTSIKNTYASENGLKALKAIRTMSESKCYQDGSNVGNAVNWAAIVDGTWDSSSAKEVLGDNYACAPLPKFTVDGETFQLGGFGGFKLLGVKPQAEIGKLAVCMELAKYLSDTDAQLTRFNEVGWGPSNLTAQQDSAVQNDEALSALRQQLQYTIPQGQYPNDYWSEADALGETICGGNFKGYTDEQLMAELEAFASKMNALVQQ